MDKTTNKLFSISKIATAISLVCFLFILLATYVFESGGFVVALVISTLAGLTALISTGILLAKGAERTGLLILLFFVNAICLVIYGVMIFYAFFIVPVAVNEMMN